MLYASPHNQIIFLFKNNREYSYAVAGDKFITLLLGERPHDIALPLSTLIKPRPHVNRQSPDFSFLDVNR